MKIDDRGRERETQPEARIPTPGRVAAIEAVAAVAASLLVTLYQFGFESSGA